MQLQAQVSSRSIQILSLLMIGLLFLGSFYFHLNQGGTGLRIPNNIVVWAVACVFIFMTLWHLSKAEVLRLPRHYLLLLSFPLLTLYGGLVSGVEVPDVWLFRLLYIWGGTLFLFSLYQYPLTQRSLDRLLHVVVMVAAIHAVIGIIQIYFLNDMPRGFPRSASGIPAGLFQQINNQASFQATSTLITLWLLARTPLALHTKLKFSLLISALLVSAFVIGYSGSRVGLLGLLLAIPFLLRAIWPDIKQQKRKWLVIMVLLITAISSANLFENQRGLTSVVEKTTALNAGFSGSARLSMYTIALDLVKQAPWTGHGIGSFVRVWQLAKPDFYLAHPEATLPGQRVSHPHNEVIFWLVEGGILSALGLLGVTVAVLLFLSRLPVSKKYRYFAFLIPITLHTQVELPFYISALHWFLFLMLIFLASRHTLKPIQLNLSGAARSSVRLVSVIGLCGTFVFFTHTFLSNKEFQPYTKKLADNRADFHYALDNPYFRSLAQQQNMVYMLYQSMRRGLNDNVSLYAQWGDAQLKHNPHILLYITTAQAYLYLKNVDKSCAIARQGAAVYPRNKDLKNLLKKCR